VPPASHAKSSTFERCCPSPPWDELAPILVEEDIPGVPTAKEVQLAVDKMLVSDLALWLESRGLRKKGKKEDLVQR